MGGGVCFQKLKLPLTWGQSLCPSESCSNLLTSLGADVLMETEIFNDSYQPSLRRSLDSLKRQGGPRPLERANV